MKNLTLIMTAVAIFVCGFLLGNVINSRETKLSLQSCNIISSKWKENTELCINGLIIVKAAAIEYTDWANKQQLQCQNELKSCRAKN